MQNKYCAYDALRNEADVEQTFVRRMLEDLGFNDREIRPKDSLRRLPSAECEAFPNSAIVQISRCW